MGGCIATVPDKEVEFILFKRFERGLKVTYRYDADRVRDSAQMDYKYTGIENIETD